MTPVLLPSSCWTSAWDPVLFLASIASFRQYLLCQPSLGANMAPSQALVTTDDCHPTLNLTYAILSLSFIFVSGLFLAYRSIVRRQHQIHDSAHLRTTFSFQFSYTMQSGGSGSGLRLLLLSPHWQRNLQSLLQVLFIST